MPLPPSNTRVNIVPVVSTSLVAPIARSSAGAASAPTAPITTDAIRPSVIICTAARAAPPASRSPTRRATTAVPAIASPMAIVYTTIIIDSVRPTVATALAPSRATKNTSESANRLSMIISRTIGMARRKMERPIAPVV